MGLSEQKPGQINFVEWFDIYNHKHLFAYTHLQQYGFWPAGFLPANCFMPTLWSATIASKMADAWVFHMLKGMKEERQYDPPGCMCNYPNPCPNQAPKD